MIAANSLWETFNDISSLDSVDTQMEFLESSISIRIKLKCVQLTAVSIDAIHFCEETLFHQSFHPKLENNIQKQRIHCNITTAWFVLAPNEHESILMRKNYWNIGGPKQNSKNKPKTQLFEIDGLSECIVNDLLVLIFMKTAGFS